MHPWPVDFFLIFYFCVCQNFQTHIKGSCHPCDFLISFSTLIPFVTVSILRSIRIKVKFWREQWRYSNNSNTNIIII